MSDSLRIRSDENIVLVNPNAYNNEDFRAPDSESCMLTTPLEQREIQIIQLNPVDLEAEQRNCCCTSRTWGVVALVAGAILATIGALVLFGAISVGSFGLPLMIAGAVGAAVALGVTIKMIVDACKARCQNDDEFQLSEDQIIQQANQISEEARQREIDLQREENAEVVSQEDPTSYPRGYNPSNQRCC